MAGICFAVAAVNVVFAGEDLLTLLRGFSERRPVIASAHYMATSLLLVPMVVSVGLLFLFGKQATPEDMKRAAGRSMKRSGIYFAFIAASVVTAIIAPLPQYWIVAHVAAADGYVSCPTPDWPRHQPDRWALVGAGRCPGRGADPNS